MTYPIRDRVSIRTTLRAGLFLIGLMTLLVPSFLVAQTSDAPTFRVLHRFRKQGFSGRYPSGRLVMDNVGNLYGVTSGGPYGTVYKMDRAGNVTVLHSFAGGSDGAEPTAGLILDAAGNLYGTTSRLTTGSHGTVFMLDPAGQEVVLYRFTGGLDGSSPQAELLLAADGGLYGTTFEGGDIRACPPRGCGVVFKADAFGAEQVLYRFTGGADGGFPQAGLIRDGTGSFYGTTTSGGTYGHGVVFKLEQSVETVLYDFPDEVVNGSNPSGSLIEDNDGNFYGVTSSGGTYGYGVIFKLDRARSETVLYSFTGGADGRVPLGSLLRDSSGNLYGVTSNGGDLVACRSGCGVVFKLGPTGILTVLHTFNVSDGEYPVGGLIRGPHNWLYGVTSNGGGSTRGNSGTIIEVKPNATGDR